MTVSSSLLRALYKLGPFQFLLRFFNGLDAQRRWKDLGAVFLAAQQVALFQPGHRGLHPRVVGGGVAREGVVLVFPQDFADGGDDLVLQLLLAVEVAQRPEDTVNFPLAEAGTGRQAELRLHVVTDVEQQAARRFPVAAGASGFLQVVLQGGRDVGVNDQPHVGLVDPHAEGVGGGDDFQVPVDEALLHVLLGVRSEAGMEVIGADVLVSQEFRYLLGAMAAGAIDNGATGLVGRQVGGQQVVDEGELLAARRRDDLEAQVVARRAAVEDVELDTESFLEVLDDLGDDRGLGGGGQAQDGGNLAVSGLVADEAADVTVVGPEVLAPFGQAVGLVEHPAADFALIQGLSQGAVAQLLGGDEHDAGVAQAHLVEGVASFRHGQQAVDGDAGCDAARLQPGHLIRHQGYQGRDDHGEGAGLVVAGQGGNLVAQGFAGAGRQDAEDVPAGHDGFDDGLLHGAAVVLGNGPEGGKAEPALQFLFGVVAFAAPGAAGVAAGGVAQVLQQEVGFRELVFHPRRQDRVAAGHREPGEDVGQGPVGWGQGGHDFTSVNLAGVASQTLVDGGVGLGVCWSEGVAQAGEEEVAAGCLVVRGSQPVPGDEELRGGF